MTTVLLDTWTGRPYRVAVLPTKAEESARCKFYRLYPTAQAWIAGHPGQLAGRLVNTEKEEQCQKCQP